MDDTRLNTVLVARDGSEAPVQLLLIGANRRTQSGMLTGEGFHIGRGASRRFRKLRYAIAEQTLVVLEPRHVSVGSLVAGGDSFVQLKLLVPDCSHLGVNLLCVRVEVLNTRIELAVTRVDL